MNSRRKQIIKVGIAVLIVVLLGMMLTHCTNTTGAKSVKSDKTVEKSKKKANAKKPGKNKATDVDKASGQEEKKKKQLKQILLINQILQNQRRITQLLLRILAQTRTIQVLLNLQTTVAITLVHLNHQITMVQVQTTQSQPNIHMTGLHSIRR